MLSTDIPRTDCMSAEASTAGSAPPPLPRLCSTQRCRAEWGDVGNTKFYDLIREHNVPILKIGGKTVIAGEDVARVADAIIAAGRQASIDARALAAKSVAARRNRLGAAQSTAPPARRRRRRGGTTP